MAVEQKRGSKTQSLSLRLDPKTKFIVEFIARIRGQTITTVVERAIKLAADEAGLEPKWDEESKTEIGMRYWMAFWDPSEGIRTLKLLADGGYPTTYEEDELRAFTLVHWQFFYTTSKGYEPRRAIVEILWPSMDRYLQTWREKKSEDFWAAGEAMKADLAAARVAPPEWPPKEKPDSRPSTAAPEGGNLDDDIPF